jgi:hemerythrin-like domain-containing protein
MTATDTLRDEHRGIERVLAIVEAAVIRLETNQVVPPELFRNAADFFQGFVDTCHHAKEETELFPALESRGIPRQGGPVGVMLHEHEEGRGHVRALSAAADRYAAGDKTAVSDVIEHARSYTLLLRQHIVKENTILFAMADRMLSAEEQDTLSEAFERVEQEKTGPGEHERYHGMIEELERQAATW